jgi:hypothetical protein
MQVHYIINESNEIPLFYLSLQSIFQDLIDTKSSLVIHTTNELKNVLQSSLKFSEQIECIITQEVYSQGHLIPNTAVFMIGTLKENLPLKTSTTVVHMTEQIFSSIVENAYDFTTPKIFLFSDDTKQQTYMIMNIVMEKIHEYYTLFEKQLD